MPRRLSIGDLHLVNALMERSSCDVILGLTGDEGADEPVHDLLEQLTDQDIQEIDTASHYDSLPKKAACR